MPNFRSGCGRGRLAEGFDLCGVAGAPAAEDADGEVTAARFTEWVERGRAGEMEYLKRRDEAGELLRRSARVAMPWARSVVVCAMNYNAAGPRSIDAAAGRRVDCAVCVERRRAGGAVDYHDDLLVRLRTVEAGAAGRVECRTKCYVDTGPLLERDFAARAGVGWVGKNTCVLNEEQGSWLLLGVIVTSLEVAAGLTLARRRTGVGAVRGASTRARRRRWWRRGRWMRRGALRT